MPDRRVPADIVRYAFEIAIADRHQVGLDEQTTCSENSAAAFKLENEMLALQSYLFSEKSNFLDAWNKIKKLSEENYEILMNALYFAEIYSISITEAKPSAHDVRESKKNLLSFQRIVTKLYRGEKNQTSWDDLESSPTVNVSRLVREDEWEKLPCGGKRFIPKLPY